MKGFLVWLIVFAGFVCILGAYMTIFPGENKSRGNGAATGDEQELADRMHSVVESLSTEYGSRDNNAAVDGAGSYLSSLMRHAGYDVREEESGSPGVKNIVADLPGTKSANELLVIAAHYDSESHSPGADANASGCAVLLEIARSVANTAHERTLRFALLANGAGRYAGEPSSGAHAFVEALVKSGQHVAGVIVLDSVGHFEDKTTQSYPFPLMLAYDNRADFLGCFGNCASRDLVAKTVQLGRAGSKVPFEGFVIPSLFPGTAFSDHSAFSDKDIRVVTITDTGSYRSKYWGNSFDTHDRLDYVRMARAVSVIGAVVAALARKANLE